MTKIENEMQYNSAMERINQLLKEVNDDTPEDDIRSVELVLQSNLVADYEDEHYPIKKPTQKQARKMSQELNIGPANVLGV